MQVLLLYAFLVLCAALLSARAAHSAYSNAALFLVAGVVASATGLADFDPQAQWLRDSADVAVFGILFTDGMRLSIGELRRCWRLPGRALLLGMPLTIALLALFARVLFGLSWAECVLVGGVLASTDPVFASVLLERSAVPLSLRRLLNVESGLNDGLALPVVLGVLAWLARSDETPLALAAEVAGGIALGFALPYAAVRLRRLVPRELPTPHRALFVIAIGLLLYAACDLAGVNKYLAAFTAGVVLATCAEEDTDSFAPVGESAGELLKDAALLVFAVVVGWSGVLDTGWRELAYAAAALLLARPVAILLVLLGSSLGWPERLAAAWFGPKGFASVVYAVLVVQSGVDNGSKLFHLSAVVILVSMLAHSSTDVAVAGWFRRRAQAADEGEAQGPD
jgi:NhaP-type Na+/H+ or K+/H+ antiporter